jgi:hypothetical protein
VLYGKAVEVLLMTWNTEGHEPISDEEALPQLCFVASAMMRRGIQKISRPKLATLLQDARSALPTELGYVKDTVDQFIHRVEDRSSLLMMTGHDIEDGQLVEFFEFRHLTFQEFLTARAMVEGWHPGRKAKDKLVNVLQPYFHKPEWREVIPLAAVLGGKETESLIVRMTELVRQIATGSTGARKASVIPVILANTLADEAAARPQTIRAALREVIRTTVRFVGDDPLAVLARSRYGVDFREEAQKAFLGSPPDVDNAKSALATAIWSQMMSDRDESAYGKAATWIASNIESQDQLTRCEAALACVELCFELHEAKGDDARRKACVEQLRGVGDALTVMVMGHSIPEQAAACWALAWLGTWRMWSPPSSPDILGRLFSLSRSSPDAEIRRLAAWAMANQKLCSREEGRCSTVARKVVQDLMNEYKKVPEWDKASVLCAAYYLSVRPNDKIAQMANEHLKEHLGPGKIVLEDLSAVV